MTSLKHNDPAYKYITKTESETPEEFHKRKRRLQRIVIITIIASVAASLSRVL